MLGTKVRPNEFITSEYSSEKVNVEYMIGRYMSNNSLVGCKTWWLQTYQKNFGKRLKVYLVHTKGFE